MGIKEQIEADIKSAMLGGYKDRANILRTLKSSILEVEIAQNKRGEGLSEQELMSVLSKESKKRQDTADVYLKANEQERASKELHEKSVIDAYLPAQLTNDELNSLIDTALSEQDGKVELQQMGKIIALVKERCEGKADGGRIAQAVKEKIS